MRIAGRSLAIAATSCVIATLISIPLGSAIHFNNFRGKRLLVNIIQTFYSVPTVVVGLFVFVLVSRAGPLGSLGLLYTPPAIVIGQVLLVLPIMMGLTISALRGVDVTLTDTAISLGANRFQTASLVIREARFAMLGAVTMGFGRVISEVGLSLMVGGNIKGLILLFIALVVNIILNRLQMR